MKKRNYLIRVISKYVHLLAHVLPIHKVTGTIRYPSRKKGEVAAHAMGIVTACTNNVNCTISAGDLTFVTNTITAFTSAVAANRPGKKKLMDEAIEEKLLALFQAKSNADPINSIM